MKNRSQGFARFLLVVVLHLKNYSLSMLLRVFQRWLRLTWQALNRFEIQFI